MFVVALAAAPALAGGLWVGGTAGYGNTNAENMEEEVPSSSTSSWNISPELGYNLNAKWDIGLGLSYESKQKNVDEVTMKASPFARYKLYENGKFSLLAKGTLFYAYTMVDNADDTTINQYGITIAPVVEYKLNDKWSVVATLNFAELSYTHKDVDAKGDPKSDEFGFNVNNGSIANIGFLYRF